MYFNGKELISFDIETTGLSAVEDKFICSAVHIPSEEKTIVDNSVDKLYNTFFELNKEDYILITYNGENYRTGFDFPFLRTKLALSDRLWVFKNWYHIDLYPLVQKYFNNKISERKIPSKSSLYKKDLVKLAKANNIEYQNKNTTYKMLENMKNTDWLDYVSKKSQEKYDEQSVYQTFFDPKGEQEYIEGADVPDLYEKGFIDDIIRHNVNDIQRLNDLAELLIPYIPDYEIERSIIQL